VLLANIAGYGGGLVPPFAMPGVLNELNFKAALLGYIQAGGGGVIVAHSVIPCT